MPQYPKPYAHVRDKDAVCTAPYILKCFSYTDITIFRNILDQNTI